jgi:glycosyltransferase involved in cell wall biosynthesis
MNMLMVGTRYLPYRHEGDKNFWIPIVESLKRDGASISIISLNRDYYGAYFQGPYVYVENVTPFLFPSLRSKFSNASLRLSNSYVSRTSSFLKIEGEIARLLDREQVQLLHLMDNYGPVMIRLRKKAKIPLTVFAPTYHRRHLMYDYLLRLSLTPFDKIITTTHAFKRKLVDLGLPRERIVVIRWGVDTQVLKPDPKTRAQAKQELGLGADSKLILWSGFLQQSGMKELQYSLGLAGAAIEQFRNCNFVFALKHVHFKPEYRGYERDGLRVVSTTSNADFLRLVNASDALLSPILADSSTAAPPLTWIESMAHGVPIITTNVGGVDELVLDGRTGYTFKTVQEALQRIRAVLENESDHRKISQESRRIVCADYDIRTIADTYKNLWKRMCE